MRAHPLFNDDPDNVERLTRDIGFLQVFRFSGSKRTALPGQWEPEEIQTIEDLYNAVGPGRFEVFGRDTIKKNVVDRVIIEIEAPKGSAPAPEPRPEPAPQAYAQPPAPQVPGVPMMSGAGLQIPTGIDPQTAVVMMFMQSQTAQAAAQREDSRNQMALMQSMFLGFSKNQTDLVVGLVGGLRGAPAGGETSSETGFIKGIETMAALVEGVKGGKEEGAEKPASFGEIAQNIAQGLSAMRDIAQATSGGAGVVTPIIPPGTP